MTKVCFCLLIALVAAACSTHVAVATQHLVAPGDRWEQLEERLKPGDEVIFLPGRHRHARLSAVQGTAERPIVFRSVDPSSPAVIQAERFGIEIKRPRHLRIQDLTITGATISGLALNTHADEEESVPPEDAVYGDVRVERVSITETGEKGERHAIMIEGLQRVRIVNCTVEAWAGSAVEIVGCQDVNVDRCRFAGREGFEQTTGVRVRGGSDRVFIDQCHLTGVGEQGLCIGGASKLADFASTPDADSAPDSLFEASRVQVTRAVVEGGLCAVAFVNCERSSVRNCTFVRPQRAVISLRRDQDDPRFGPVTNCTFGSNLVVWEPGDLTSIALHKHENAEHSLYLDENLWWGADLVEGDEMLGGFPGVDRLGQVIGVDPALDETLRPTVATAELFGAYAP